MGNVCCGYDDEAYKHGAWYTPDDDDGDGVENCNGFFGDEEDQYNEKATNREKLIRLHESSRSSTRRISLFKTDLGVGGVDADRGRKKRLTRMKRESITCAPLDLASGYTPPSFPKSPETTDFLVNSLADNFIFDQMDEGTKLRFVDAMQSHEFNEGDWVMHQGDVGDYFYILVQGEVAFHVAGESAANAQDPDSLPPQVGEGSSGSTFGELALLYNTPRAASVRAMTPLKLYKIDQFTFRALMMSSHESQRTNIISLVRELSVFQGLDESKLRKLVDAFTMVEFGKGERIVNKGDHGEILYIVKSGQVRVEDIGHGNSKFQDHVLEEGAYFGERALITGEKRAANVTAVVQSSLLAISKQKLEKYLGPLEQAIMFSCYSKLLQSIPLFECLEQDDIDKCVKHLVCERFQKGEKIPSKGKLYLIQEGSALMVVPEDGHQNDKKKAATVGPKLVKLMTGDYFGDLWGDFDEEENIEPQETQAADKDENLISVESNMKCLTLLGSNVQQRVAGDLKRQTKNSKSQYLKQSFSKLKSKRQLSNGEIRNLSCLKKHRILGIGTFGKVWLVTPVANAADNATPYALKMISKRQLLQQNLAAPILREKNVMESIEHPFLPNMISSFQDENYLYFVMDLVRGGELFELMYEKGKKSSGADNGAWKESAFYKSFGNDEGKLVKSTAGLGVRKSVFYSAGVIEAFAYLHSRKIVYRDLKPENILINKDGYCIVVDLGFAKVVLDKTYTVCGTLEYLAPEVIVNKGHNYAADYWSFGCLLYELIVGQTPFFDAGLDQMSLLRKIVKANYKFPLEMAKLSPDSGSDIDKAICHWKDLVSRLLKPKNVERIGNLRNGIEDILDHDWFANLDFDEFRSANLPAPWTPKIDDALGVSFGNNFGREEEKSEVFARKLTAKDQEAFKNF